MTYRFDAKQDEYVCDDCGEFEQHCRCDDFGDDERACHWCGGDGWVECPHPLECTRRHTSTGECRCGSCGGSGLAKDMTVW